MRKIRVVYCDHERGNVIVAKHHLRQKFDFTGITDITVLAQMIVGENVIAKPDVVLLGDRRSLDSLRPVLGLCEEYDIPVILLSPQPDRPEIAEASFKQGFNLVRVPIACFNRLTILILENTVHVLVLEDDELLTRAYRRLLRVLGIVHYQVIRDYKGALAQLESLQEQDKPCIVMTDFKLDGQGATGQDMIDVCFGCGVPVMLVTADLAAAQRLAFQVPVFEKPVPMGSFHSGLLYLMKEYLGTE